MEENKIYTGHKILDRPILGCVLMLLWGCLFYQIFAGIIGAVLNMVIMNKAITYIFAVIAGILLLIIHQLWFKGEFKGFLIGSGLKKRDLWILIGIWVIFEAVLQIYDYADGGIKNPTFTIITDGLMAGVAEEAAFRGLSISVMMRKYKDKGSLLTVVFLPAILFGLCHAVNFHDEIAIDLISQIIFAISAGCFFGVIYLRTGNILVTMGLHSIYDIFAMLANNLSEDGATTAGDMAIQILITLAVAAVNIALALLLLKGHDEDIRTLWREIWPEVQETEENLRKAARKRLIVTGIVIAAVIVLVVVFLVVLNLCGAHLSLSVG